ncbi:MAG: acetyl-CoA decarbonylase/synthase complex subunit gamma [Candidatus Bathyarchaeia archaeon]
MSRKVQPLQIYMLLPRRNCGRCGVTTCLAFAAKLTSGEATPDLCPFLTPQSKAKISALIMPPVRPIPISSLSSTIEVGGEEGLFRHDGGFRREARLAYTIDLSSNMYEVRSVVSHIDSIVMERMGLKLSIDLYLVDMSGVTQESMEDRLRIFRKYTCKPLILKADNFDAYLSALRLLEGEKPAIMIDTSLISLEKFMDVVSVKDYPIVLLAKDIDTLGELTARIEDAGIEKIILGIRYHGIGKLIRYTLGIRKRALEGDKRFSYPILVDLKDISDSYEGLAASIASLLRYSSIVILPRSMSRVFIEGLLIFKQSIYTDPRRPRIVNPGIYSIGSTSRSAPIVVTSNYALTFDIVRRILEASGIGCWILVIDTGGLSVASAIGGGKFTARQIAEALQAYRDKVDIDRVPIIIPGLASSIKPELETLGFNIIVGPVKAKDLPILIKSLKYG